ncbi:MAG: glutamine-hydrolyzing carbamoyl-phosphate synthase small subunit [Candidatus Obscuribacterales bacterium]|nr:glutamine-hydrolyzing carbamoyl-phosphate synthase small subunit [Candidatus Obscuribacterales bacterium]
MTSKVARPGFGQGQSPCLIALEDGRTFTGIHFGAPGTQTGELVFNTSLTGYQEILSDPSYAGQIVTMTYPEIGNYGTCDADWESRKIFARGLVIRHLSRRYSSWRSTKSLGQFLQEQSVIGIADVDTRAITRHIRDKGAMRCAISSEILDPKELVKIAAASPDMSGADFTGEVTTPESYELGSKGDYHIVVLDFGIKKNILNKLEQQGFKLTVLPASATASDILGLRPDGLFLSNGPGDPAACSGILSQLPALIKTEMPIFGICLGHQLLALALGAKTYKLKFGHRGGNQPVKDLLTGKIEITCQNHGFAVDSDSLPKELELTHINLNDNSVEGFRHRHLPIFCVQYHPESSPGPHDSEYLFARFRQMIEESKVSKKTCTN